MLLTILKCSCLLCHICHPIIQHSRSLGCSKTPTVIPPRSLFLLKVPYYRWLMARIYRIRMSMLANLILINLIRNPVRLLCLVSIYLTTLRRFHLLHYGETVKRITIKRGRPSRAAHVILMPLLARRLRLLILTSPAPSIKLTTRLTNMRWMSA